MLEQVTWKILQNGFIAAFYCIKLILGQIETWGLFISDELIKKLLWITHNPPQINKKTLQIYKKNPINQNSPNVIKSSFWDEQTHGTKEKGIKCCTDTLPGREVDQAWDCLNKKTSAGNISFERHCFVIPLIHIFRRQHCFTFRDKRLTTLF